uniref:ATPase phospholipid transporting 8B2 n=1 Tax=Sander lucioperca TaxID=283035 RepID=A0A8C9YIU2_SANLU
MEGFFSCSPEVKNVSLYFSCLLWVFSHSLCPLLSAVKLFGCSAAAQVKTSRETKGQFLSVNMAFSVGVMSAMYLTKNISGAHFNPAVTLSFCVLGQVPWGKLVPYCLSQVLGAYLASGLVYMVYYDAIMEFSGGVLTVYGPNETASIFATYPSEYMTLGRSFLDQVVGTGMLMLCILCLEEKRNTPAPSELIPAIVAVIVLGISMSMSANCGAAINPARDLGPRLLTLTAGWGTEVFTFGVIGMLKNHPCNFGPRVVISGFMMQRIASRHCTNTPIQEPGNKVAMEFFTLSS